MVYTTRRLSEDQAPLPDEIKIAKDGEPIQVLGALIGNKVDQASVWSPTLENVDQRFIRWEQSHPTPEGRCLIVNLVAGGLTQYLTRVQGMPVDIETMLSKKVSKFMWGNATPMVNIETLHSSHIRGGKSLLDIARRNRAIEIMKLRTYLQPHAKRPRWTLVVEHLMGKTLPRSHVQVQDEVKLNVFLQNWKPKVRGDTKLSSGIHRLLREAEQSKLLLDIPLPSVSLLQSLPIWHHKYLRKEEGVRNNSIWADCQRQVHGIKTV
ncbi:hypothetical protein CPC08DRAFT_645612, partial [Agrocybe pediades]